MQEWWIGTSEKNKRKSLLPWSFTNYYWFFLSLLVLYQLKRTRLLIQPMFWIDLTIWDFFSLIRAVWRSLDRLMWYWSGKKNLWLLSLRSSICWKHWERFTKECYRWAWKCYKAIYHFYKGVADTNNENRINLLNDAHEGYKSIGFCTV